VKLLKIEELEKKMDTTTVNFAINKLTAGWQAVAPSIQDVGEKYVRYVVMKEVLSAIIAATAFLVLLGFFVWAVRRALATKDADYYMPIILVGGGILV
jgi:hypothetical protein